MPKPLLPPGDAAFHTQVKRIMRHARRLAQDPSYRNDETGAVRWRDILAACYTEFALDPNNPAHEALSMTAIEQVQDDHVYE